MMVSNEKLRAIVLEANEKVRTDPELIKRKEKLARELSTISPEDLHKRILVRSDIKRIKP